MPNARRGGGEQCPACDAAAMAREPSTDDDLVDDHTYDLLQALTASLEAVDAYREFAADTPGSIFDDLLRDERRQAATLLAALRERLLA